MQVTQQDLLLPVQRPYPLAYSKFIPSGHIKKVLLISSATGVPQEFYRKFARFMAANGIVTYTFDYSGIGRSGGNPKGMRTHTGGVTSWGSIDQAQMTALIKKEYPNTSLGLITHSIGGQILGLNPENKHFDKVITIASQHAGQHSYSGWSRIKVSLFFNVFIPILTPIFGYYPGAKIQVFTSLPGSMAVEWARWGRKKDYLLHYHKAHFFSQIGGQIRCYSFAKDWLAPKKGVDWLAQQFTNAQVERIHYNAKNQGKQPKHFGFFKKEFKITFWQPTLSWLLE